MESQYFIYLFQIQLLFDIIFSMSKIVSSVFLIFLALAVASHSQCCLELDPKFNLCLTCPPGTHKFRDNCILDVPDCLEHANGFDCLRCK